MRGRNRAEHAVKQWSTSSKERQMMQNDRRVKHLLGRPIVKLKTMIARRIQDEKLNGMLEAGKFERQRRTRVCVGRLLDEKGTAAVTESGRQEIVGRFYDKLFAIGDSAGRMPRWIFKSWGEDIFLGWPELDGALMGRMICKLAANKSCGEDTIVAEMLKALDWDGKTLLAEIIKLRIRNHESEWFDDAWMVRMVALIPKVPRACTITKFRPITVSAVLLKLVSMVLLEFTASLIDVAIGETQFAFRPGYQAHEVVYCLRHMIEKKVEYHWPPMVLVAGDIYKFYDSIKHPALIQRLTKAGLPRFAVASWVRETRHSRACFVLPGSAPTRGVVRERSLIQGEPAAPGLSAVHLQGPLDRFRRICRGQGWGISLGVVEGELEEKNWLDILNFADNFWIVAKNTLEAARMTECWLDLLENDGLEVPLRDMEWGWTAQDVQQASLTIRGTCIKKVKRNEGMQVLGTQITLDNCATVEVANRLRSA